MHGILLYYFPKISILPLEQLCYHYSKDNLSIERMGQIEAKQSLFFHQKALPYPVCFVGDGNYFAVFFQFVVILLHSAENVLPNTN